jgi:hypothetical protein
VKPGTGAGRLPDFIVIGAMKSGSTTLWGLLGRHPQIFMCEPKEPQFFSRDERFERGMDAYRALFAGAGADQIAGEASTCYSRWPHYGDVAGRIARALPDVKLVYQLRHPVDRAYSHYRHLMEERAARGSQPVISFAAALDEIPEIIDASRYRMQLAQYLAHFARERIHVLTLDDLRANPASTWRALQRFLGVGELAGEAAIPVDNPSGTKIARGEMRRLIRHVRALPAWAAVKRLIPRNARHGVRAWLLRPDVARRFQRSRMREHQEDVSALDADTRHALLSRLEDSTRELEEWFERPLPEWRR